MINMGESAKKSPADEISLFLLPAVFEAGDFSTWRLQKSLYGAEITPRWAMELVI
jgi:hypothetical protein